MKVTLEKTFPMPASTDIAWTLLQDVPAVAACMPGANITEQIDATHYKGTVAVKLGPASLAFRGEVEVMAVDAAARTIRLVGKGTDTTGGSGASMDLTARLEATGAETSNLLGTSDVSMSGKAAAFGGRMMGSVADQILKQFAANFANKVQALQAQAQPVAGAEAPTGAAEPAVAAVPAAAAAAVDLGAAGSAAVPELPRGTAPAAGSAPVSSPPPAGAAETVPLSPESAPGAGAVASRSAAAASAPASPSVRAAPPPSLAQPANELNALALLWAVFKDWLRSLFGAKRA